VLLTHIDIKKMSWLQISKISDKIFLIGLEEKKMDSKSYKLVCKVYYCKWESEVYDTYEEADNIKKCPKCGASRLINLQLVEVEK